MKSNNLLLQALVLVSTITLGLHYAPRVRHSAEAGSIPDLLELVPGDATLVAYADVANLRSSPLVHYLAAAAQPPKVDHDYADFIAATGFDYQKDLDRVVLAVRSAPAAQTLVFAEGRFDEAKIQAYALRAGKRDMENGRDVYVVPSDTKNKGKDISIAFLSAGRIELAEGGDSSSPTFPQASTPPLDQASRERLARVSGAPLFAVAKASSFNPGKGGHADGAAALGSPFAALKWVDLAARPDGALLILSAEGECDSEDQAQKVAAALEFVRGLVHGGLANPKARGQMPAPSAATADRLLQAVHVTTEASRVRLLLTVTPDMIAPASVPAASQSK